MAYFMRFVAGTGDKIGLFAKEARQLVNQFIFFTFKGQLSRHMSSCFLVCH